MDSPDNPTHDATVDDDRSTRWRVPFSVVMAMVVVAFVMFRFSVKAYFIASGAMRNTLKRGDRILVFGWPGVRLHPRRGDIVVFKAPVTISASRNQTFVKRVVAVTGDTVAVDRGVLVVNGKKVVEPYVRQPIQYDFPPTPFTDAHRKIFGPVVTLHGQRRVKVPPGMLFVLGDNRNDSNDSHRWGFLPEANVQGRAVMIFWPPGRARRL